VLEHIFEPAAMVALFKVVMIDLVLAGDNAIVIGMAAAGLPKELRAKAILVGIAAATVLRIIFAIVAVQLLQIVGLVLVGGLLLLWVCWKMWNELREGHHNEDALEAITGEDLDHSGTVAAPAKKTFAQAAWQILVADISMSLDNVLAVAGAAREHPYVLIFGLILSIALMGLAASFIAKLLSKYRWIGYVGLAIIVYVSLDMIYRGGIELMPHMQAWMGSN
jgi:YjbE family integral membrane protein